jgi:hypothetical protein
MAEAQERAAGLTLPGLGNGNSVSEYFRLDNEYHAYLDVRQTDDWEVDQHDPIFKDLSGEGTWIPLQDVVDLKARPDEDFEQAIHYNVWEEFMATHLDAENEDAASPTTDGAVTGDAGVSQPEGSRKRRYRYDSSHQEDILARLGVEGAAKPHSPRDQVAESSQGEETNRWGILLMQLSTL